MNMRSIAVLIVEDEAITAIFMETMLMRKGFHVLKCLSSGEEAVDYAITFRPDLVIMDIRLGGKMDGLDAVMKIKAGSEFPTQFVFITGYSDQEIVDQAMKLGPLAFMTKPVNLPELVHVIESYFLNH